MDALSPALAFGLPVAAVMVVMMAAADRVLRAGERRGLIGSRRNWTSAAIGNALLELHLAVEPAKAAPIELLAEVDDLDEDDAIGDGRNSATSSNVILIDFVRRRRV
jgi:hypothetical protein